MKDFARPLFIWLALTVSSPAGASALFEDSAVIDAELTGKLGEAVRSKQERREWPMVLRVGGEEINLKVRVRGKSRLRVCDFPPLRFNFAKGAADGTVFEGQDKIKLVTHCRNNDSGEANVLKEYLAYRVFKLLTDTAYRVRLLRLSYTDLDGRLDEDARLRYGFVIESEGQLAARVGGVPIETARVALGQFDPEHLVLVYVFQYLVGNTDWSLVSAEEEEYCCHNGDLFDVGGRTSYVPYDFDLSGIVNAAYARPAAGTNLRVVTDRRYRGFCNAEELLPAAIRGVLSHQADIEALVKSTPGLTPGESGKILSFLGGFFERAEKEDKLLKRFRRDCLKP